MKQIEASKEDNIDKDIKNLLLRNRKNRNASYKIKIYRTVLHVVQQAWLNRLLSNMWLWQQQHYYTSKVTQRTSKNLRIRGHRILFLKYKYHNFTT